MDRFWNVGQLLWMSVYVLLALISSGHAVTRRRDPRAALWWVAMSWALPILGSALYYFFGINRIERKAVRLRKKRLPPSLFEVSWYGSSDSVHSMPPSLGHLGALSRLVEGIVGLPLTKGNSVKPLFTGDDAYAAMIAAIDQAKVSVGLSAYIFNNDQAGQRFVEALARAVARKVQVRVLLDDVGSRFLWSSVLDDLSQRHVPVARFLPTFVPWRMAYMNLRNHRKILTVDGRVGFTGGMNIHAGHLVNGTSKHRTQDIHFQVIGPVVSQMQEAFCKDWYFAAGELLKGERWFPKLGEQGTVLARGIVDGPDEDYDKYRWTLLSALSNAKKSVRIATPYFIPDASLITQLNLASMSGVQVDILIPQINDLALVQWACQAMLWQVLEHGCRVWEVPPPFDHSKLMTVDSGWSLLGSSNWDPRSLRLNFEFDVECYDEPLTKELEALLDKKIAGARKLTLTGLNRRKLPVKLRDGAARLLFPLL